MRRVRATGRHSSQSKIAASIPREVAKKLLLSDSQFALSGTSRTVCPRPASISTSASSATRLTNPRTAQLPDNIHHTIPSDSMGSTATQTSREGGGPFVRRALPRGSLARQDMISMHPHTPTCSSTDSRLSYPLFSARYAPNINGKVILDHVRIEHSTPTAAAPRLAITSNSLSNCFSPSTILTIAHKAYPYTQDLLTLHNCSKTTHTARVACIPGITDIVSPLHPAAWAQALQNHPDARLCKYILLGLQHEFRTGFDHTQPLSPARPSAAVPSRRVLVQRICSAQGSGPSSPLHGPRSPREPFWRAPQAPPAILDLSSPLGRRVNDGIDRDSCSLQYTTVDDAARLVSQLGQGTLLAKIDITHAYRNVPVHPVDCRLLGMSWKGSVFVDSALPFGLRSAPQIFCAISDTLEWVLLQEGITCCLHYIDDFLTAGLPTSSECGLNLTLLKATCDKLGIPLAAQKIEGPTTTLTFLGIELDTQRMSMHLPQHKLVHIQQKVAHWLKKRAATKQEMLALIGELAHA